MFDLGFDKKQNCLVGIYSGMYSEEIFTACIEKVKHASALHPCNNFVLDMRKAELIVSENLVRKVYVILSKAGLDSSWKKAVLFSKECYAEIKDPSILEGYDDMRFYSTAPEAIQWLKT